MRKHISIRSRFRSCRRRSGETHVRALCRQFTEAWQWCKGRATIPASSQLPKIHPTQRPLICIINALIVPRGHRRVSVKRVAFQFANGSALSRNESNRYARWYGWRVMAQQAFVNWTPRIKIRDGSPTRVTVSQENRLASLTFSASRFAISIKCDAAQLKSLVDYRLMLKLNVSGFRHI